MLLKLNDKALKWKAALIPYKYGEDTLFIQEEINGPTMVIIR